MVCLHPKAGPQDEHTSKYCLLRQSDRTRFAGGSLGFHATPQARAMEDFLAVDA